MYSTISNINKQCFAKDFKHLLTSFLLKTNKVRGTQDLRLVVLLAT